MKVTENDLRMVRDLYHRALHKREFSSLIVKVIEVENPALKPAVDFIRTSFDPIEAQYIMATIILYAKERETLTELVEGKYPDRLIPIITKDCILEAVTYVYNEGVDETMEYVMRKLGRPIVSHIQRTGLMEITSMGLFKEGTSMPANCVAFGSLFFIYHVIRGAIARVREQKARTNRQGSNRSPEMFDNIYGVIGQEEGESDGGHIRDI